MITFLQGNLVESLPTQVIVEVNGVGYEVLIPLSSFEKLPAPGQPVKLLTHLIVREDAHILYGFMSGGERQLFRLLIQHVTGVGPRIAVNVLSGIPPRIFREAVVNGDVKALSRISGVGKKTAERIVVELKDKLGGPAGLPESMGGTATAPGDSRLNDAILALTALGFKQPEAEKAVTEAAQQLGSEAKVDDLVRACLKKGK